MLAVMSMKGPALARGNAEQVVPAIHANSSGGGPYAAVPATGWADSTDALLTI